MYASVDNLDEPIMLDSPVGWKLAIPFGDDAVIFRSDYSPRVTFSHVPLEVVEDLMSQEGVSPDNVYIRRTPDSDLNSFDGHFEVRPGHNFFEFDFNFFNNVFYGSVGEYTFRWP